MFGNKSIGESEWKPHNWNIETDPNVQTSTSRVPGPDWSSKLKYIEPNPVQPTENKRHRKKRFPERNEQSREEWSFYWDGSKAGRKCVINGEVKGNLQTTRETLVKDRIGSKQKVADRRADFPCRSPGDKSYAVPEYSTDFHKEGSTLPVVDFSRSTVLVADTFIPLQPLPKQKSLTFLEKESERKLKAERVEVKQLSEWTAASPIAPGL